MKLGNDEYAWRDELAKQSFLLLMNPAAYLSGRLVNILGSFCGPKRAERMR